MKIYCFRDFIMVLICIEILEFGFVRLVIKNNFMVWWGGLREGRIVGEMIFYLNIKILEVELEDCYWFFWGFGVKKEEIRINEVLEV